MKTCPFCHVVFIASICPSCSYHVSGDFKKSCRLSKTRSCSRGFKATFCDFVASRKTFKCASYCTFNFQVLRLILKKQGRLNFQDENQRTALFLAAMNNRPEHVEALARAGASVGERDEQRQTALHVAASNGNKKICKMSLTFGADVNSKDGQNRTPLICAAAAGCAKTAKVLLDNNANIDDISDSGDTALLAAIRNHNSSVVKLLLDRNVNVSHRDFSGLGVFETAVKWDAKECVEVMCSHERWKDVLSCAGNNMGKRPMEILIQYFPDAAKTVMNNCIHRPVSTISSRYDYTVTYDFQFLDPGPDDPDFVKGNRYFGPSTMVKYSRRDLLLHPLTQMLLDIKWSSFSFIYYLSFLFYLLFLVGYSYFIVAERKNAFRNETRIITGNKISSLYDVRGTSYYIAIVIQAFVLFQLLKEIFQIFIQRLEYFKQVENLLEWVLYSLCFIFLLPYTAPDWVVDRVFGGLNNPFYLWLCAIISIFFSFANFVLFLRRFSLFGIYITMFFVVFKSLLRVMLVFMQFIIGFAVVFYILFVEQPAFSTIHGSIVKTIVMSVGEVDFTPTFVESVGEYTTTGRPLNPFNNIALFLCVVFLYAMCITLMNLLIGIAIGDIEGVQRSAELKRMAMQVDFVAQIEEKNPRFITRKLYKPTVEMKPNKKSLCWRFRKIEKIFQGALRNISSDSEYKCPDQTVDLNNITNTLEKNKRQIKTLVSHMEAQTSMIKEMATKLNTELKLGSGDSVDLVELLTDDAGDQENSEERITATSEYAT